MNLSSYFTNSVILAYEARRNYWPTLQSTLAALDIHPSLFIMGKGNLDGLVYDHIDRHGGNLPQRQRLNYCEAVQSMLTRQLEAGREHVLVFEDDCQLQANGREILARLQEQVKSIELDFDFFYLHAVRVHSRYTRITPNLFRLDSTHGFRAVILNRRAMQAICCLRPDPAKGIDGIIKDSIHPHMNVYSVWPCIFRADADLWSYQHDRHVLPEWLDMCVEETGTPV